MPSFFLEKIGKIIDFGLPKPSQNPSKIHLKSRSQKTHIFSSILVRFFEFAAKADSASDPLGMVFCAHQTLFFRLPFAWIFNPKNLPKTLPKRGLNLQKSSLERPKTHKNRRRATTSAARDKECAQEAPKSEKWSQHGLNMAEGTLGRWPGWPPPKVVKAGI